MNTCRTAAGASMDQHSTPPRGKRSVWLRTERFPRGGVECWSIDAPAAVRQVFIIQLAVVRIHRRLQWGDRVEALDDLSAARTRSGSVSEANASRVSAFKIFSLMTDLGLRRRCACSFS